MAEREREPGFIYMESKILKQEIALSEKTWRVYCEDKVQYRPQEISIIYEAGIEVDLCIHLVKKVFDGEVVKIERNVGTNGQAKPVESGGGTDTPNNSSAREKVQGTNEVSSGAKDGELDIY
jgi:hypothetical protein